MIIAVVGSGGKTTHIHQLAKHYLSQNKSVFICTSTHMFIEEDTLISDDANLILEKLHQDGYVFAGTKDKGKVASLSLDTYLKVSSEADITLIEADGSKQMPLKICNDTEPVIYDNVDEIHVITNLTAVNKKASDVVFRLKLSSWLHEEDIITYKDIQRLIQENYLEKLHHPNIKIYPKSNHTLLENAITQLMIENKDVSMINPDWFIDQKDYHQDGTLCILIGNDQNSDYKIGSMYFIHKDTISTIQNDFLSKEIMKEIQTIYQVTTKTYFYHNNFFTLLIIPIHN